MTVTLARKAPTRSSSDEICLRSAAKGLTERTRRTKARGGSTLSASDKRIRVAGARRDGSDVGAGAPGSSSSGAALADALDKADVMDDMVETADIDDDGGDDLDRCLDDGALDETGEDACHGTLDRPSIKGSPPTTNGRSTRARAHPAIAVERNVRRSKRELGRVEAHAANKSASTSTGSLHPSLSRPPTATCRRSPNFERQVKCW